MRRPIRILIVSDDDDFAGRVLVRAARHGMTTSLVGSGDDLEVAAFGHGANVIVLDADVAPRRRTRAATAFASSHPDVPVLLTTTGPTAASLAGLPLVEKGSADALLRVVRRVRSAH